MSDTSANTATPIERPLVATHHSSRGPIVFGIGLVLAAGGLFAALEARRSTITAPATRPVADAYAGMISAPPELEIPQNFAAASPDAMAGTPGWAYPQTGAAPPRFLPGTQTPAIARRASLPKADEFAGAGPVQAYAQPDASPTPMVVYRASASASGPTAERSSAESGRGADRVEASMFAHAATTVPKGVIIQAVLETALDSNRAGPARALISRDVRGFDGSRILIPRGSRLYGEYKADLSPGQNRALIQWQRLMRPDGAVIELDSPSADPLGRAGIRGKVNTHFFERFGGAILQSTLDIGVALATRKATNGTVIVGLPGSLPQIAATPPDQVKPTLKVPQGSAVSVFVARDLDFTRVEQ